MTIGKPEDPTYRAELLMKLRDGARQSIRLAERLSDDDVVGLEVRGLLGRLQAICAELDAMPITIPDLRRPENDPFWQEPPFPFRHIGKD
jgi:hypothetical protein